MPEIFSFHEHKVKMVASFVVPKLTAWVVCVANTFTSYYVKIEEPNNEFTTTLTQ
jgi:hypothetical protein